jgi:hypothetical protein
LALTIAAVVGAAMTVAVVNGAVRSGAPLYLEAESAHLTGRFSAVDDRQASGGEYVRADSRAASRVFNPDDSVAFCFQVSEAAEYSISVRVQTRRSGQASFFGRLDYYEPAVWRVGASESFARKHLKDADGDRVSVRLEPGQHLIALHVRESGIRLDGIYISAGFGIDKPTRCDKPSTGTPGSPSPTTPATGPATEPRRYPRPSPSGGTSSPSTTIPSETPTTASSQEPVGTTPSPTTTRPPTTTPTTGGGSGSPGSGVRVAVGQSIQAAVNANPPGTTFIIAKGVHVGQSVKPKSGNTFVGEAGAVMDGGGNTDYAFTTPLLPGSGSTTTG